MSKLVGYEWRTEKGEKFSSYDGGIVSAKVSDWSHSEKSQLSGRNIVHIYWILKDDQLLPFGKDSALKELGIKQGTLKTKVNEYMSKALKEAEDFKWLLKAINKTEKYSSIQEANGYYKKLNYSPMHEKGINYLNNTACFCFNNEFLTMRNNAENNKAFTQLEYIKVIEN